MAGGGKHYGWLVEEIFKQKIDVKGWKGFRISPDLKSPKLACHGSMYASLRNKLLVWDKEMFITAIALVRVSSFYALVLQAKIFTRWCEEGKGTLAHIEEIWAYGMRISYTVSKHACSLLWRETLPIFQGCLLYTHPWKSHPEQEVWKCKKTIENYLPKTEFNFCIAIWQHLWLIMN